MILLKLILPKGGMIVGKLSKKGLFGIAVVLSAVLAAMLYFYLSAPPAGQTVMIAKTDILPKTVITESMVKETSVPKEYIQPNAIQDKTKVVGGIAREKIVAGEQITSRRLVLSGKPAGFTGIIPKDKRAMTVAVTEVTGVAGFTKPGDYVDVIVTLDQQQSRGGEPASQIILQNIPVLAANRDLEDEDSSVASDVKKNAPKMNTVTLAVNPSEALQLALGDEKGKVRLVLRPYMSSEERVNTMMVTAANLFGSQVEQPAPVYSSPAVEMSYGSYEYIPQETPKKNSPAVSNTIQMIRGTKSEMISVE